IERHGFKRGFEVDSGIERGWFSPGNLADKNCRVSRWDNVERSSQQQEHETGSADVPSKTGAQLEFRFSKFFGSTLGFFDSPTSADVVVNAEAENDRRCYQQRVSGSDQQEFQQQHGIVLSNLNGTAGGSQWVGDGRMAISEYNETARYREAQPQMRGCPA